MEMQAEETRGEIGFPLGATPEESVANMLTYLKEAAAKLQAAPRAERSRGI